MKHTTNFLTDEVYSVSPEISSALTTDYSSADYDDLIRHLETHFSSIFENQNIWVFPIITEAASNAQALRSIAENNSAIFCHTRSNVYTEHRETVDFLTQGAHIFGVEGHSAKISPSDIKELLENRSFATKRNAVSISQATEIGTLYRIDEIRALSDIAHQNEAAVHMDGTHFSHAVVALNCSPADVSWRAGVDILSFGSSRNGTSGVEVVLIFNERLLERFCQYYRRSGHSFENLWLPAVQLEAYLRDDVWLSNAAHANQMAQRLASKLSTFSNFNIQYPTETNMVCMEMPTTISNQLDAKGFRFQSSTQDDVSEVKLTTSFKTSSSEVDLFLSSINTFV
ncbi:MAG: beta-eliminating lyase-related protein [Cyanobacteria bacterium J06621_3]